MQLAAGRASARAGRVGGRRSGKGRGDADWLKARTPVSLDELSSSRSAFSGGNGTSLHRQQTCGGAAPSVTRGRAGTGGAVAHLPKQAGGKSKTNKSAHKRFKITASGKVLFHKPGKQHINRNLTSRQQRKKRRMSAVGRADIRHVQKMMPHEKKLKSGKTPTSE